MTIKAGDVVSLRDPITFGEVDANGQPVTGLSIETNLVVVLSNNRGETYVAPVMMFDPALLDGADVLYSSK
jgi:hypothetical protein